MVGPIDSCQKANHLSFANLRLHGCQLRRVGALSEVFLSTITMPRWLSLVDVSTPESIRLVSGKVSQCRPVGARVQTPPKAPHQYLGEMSSVKQFPGERIPRLRAPVYPRLI